MKRALPLAVMLLLLSAVNAQPFKREFEMFKKQDSLGVAGNVILLTGSSSFTIWADVHDYFPGYPILNRGFGGSTLQDVIDKSGEVILKYRPKQIIIYCGENDIASNDSITPNIVLQRFQQLFTIIRNKWKKMPVAFISIKPSPSRYRLINKVRQSNALIKNYLNTKKYTAFINVFDDMLGNDNRPRPELFLSDSLHMNAKGYAIWQCIMRPYIKQ